MTAPSLWDCLTEAGVPAEHRSAASIALIRFINAHTEDMQAKVRAANLAAFEAEASKPPIRRSTPWNGGDAA